MLVVSFLQWFVAGWWEAVREDRRLDRLEPGPARYDARAGQSLTVSRRRTGQSSEDTNEDG